LGTAAPRQPRRTPIRFRDRAEAGRLLADELARHRLTDPIVLALPRGGVPVGYEVASRLGAPLAVFVARKIGAPGQPELGIGAIAEDNSAVVDRATARALSVSAAEFEELATREQAELERRVQRYRGGRPLPDITGRDVVLVDDGLATGVTAEAALRALRARAPRRLVLAAPVCAPETAERLKGVADEVVCLYAPPDFGAVGAWYDDFGQTSDAEVLDLLGRAS
jgi:predicted phosphoribosyltransferase